MCCRGALSRGMLVFHHSNRKKNGNMCMSFRWYYPDQVQRLYLRTSHAEAIIEHPSCAYRYLRLPILPFAKIYSKKDTTHHIPIHVHSRIHQPFRSILAADDRKYGIPLSSWPFVFGVWRGNIDIVKIAEPIVFGFSPPFFETNYGNTSHDHYSIVE